jgi:hypothetical protein
VGNGDDPFDSEEYKNWADEMRATLIPQMRESASILMIAPRMDTKFDINFALQIGSAILLEKPLILLVQVGRDIPPKLRAIADRIIETDMNKATMDKDGIQQQIRQAMTDLGKQ